VPRGQKLNLKARAERQSQTRQRIVEAAISLHTTVGPARTTVSAIAERAGVQRQTVYAHFPDDRTLFEACSAHVRETFPPPDVGSWTKIADPQARLAVALSQLYPYFRRTAGAWSAILRDADIDALVREFAANRRLGYLRQAHHVLAVGWRARGRRREQLSAMLGLAVDFRTWETLAIGQGLDDDEAARLMARALGCTARG
jgi:AcrR family transcriptional regulator